MYSINYFKLLFKKNLGISYFINFKIGEKKLKRYFLFNKIIYIYIQNLKHSKRDKVSKENMYIYITQ